MPNPYLPFHSPVDKPLSGFSLVEYGKNMRIFCQISCVKPKHLVRANTVDRQYNCRPSASADL